MNLLGENRLIGLGRDDGAEYFSWIRTAIRDIGAHIPYSARDNAAALKKLQELSYRDAPLDFVTTDIVNVYSNNYQEGIEFVRGIRGLSDDLIIAGGHLA